MQSEFSDANTLILGVPATPLYRFGSKNITCTATHIYRAVKRLVSMCAKCHQRGDF
jgi:hypothetical protein